MSVNLEANEMDVVHILRDVMNIVCSYLEVKDLTSMSKVCKSWRDEALNAKAKRFYIQQQSLPCMFGNRESILDQNPRITLLFYHRHSPFTGELVIGSEKKLINSLKQLTHKTIAIGVEEYLTTEDVVKSDYDILQFFSPSIRIVCPQPFNLSRKEESYETALNEAVDGLGLNDCKHTKSTIILCMASTQYANRNYNFTKKLIERIQSDSEIIVLKSSNILSVNCQKVNRGVHRPWLVALRIPGPDVESWTTMIHSTALIDEIEQKVRELKERVKPRRYYFGLLYGFCFDEYFGEYRNRGRTACDMQNVMSIFKRYFPSLPFVGTLGQRFSRAEYADNNRREPTDYPFSVYSYVTIMILSYN